MPVKTYTIYPPRVADPMYAGGETFDTKGITFRLFKWEPDVQSITVDADQDQLDILEADGYAE